MSAVSKAGGQGPVSREDAARLIGSLNDWWATAGVTHAYSATPISMLTPPASATRTVPETVAVASNQHIVPSVSASASLPDGDLSDMLSWLANGEGVVERDWAMDWAAEAVMPDLRPGASVTVVVPYPESTEAALAPQTRLLFDNMLRAAAVDPAAVSTVPLSLVKPPPSAQLRDRIGPMRDRLVHLLRRAPPSRLLLLGDVTATALLGMNMIEARRRKQIVNHDGFKSLAVATLHPASLLRRPKLKAGAWQDLLMLTEPEEGPLP